MQTLDVHKKFNGYPRQPLWVAINDEWEDPEVVLPGDEVIVWDEWDGVWRVAVFEGMYSDFNDTWWLDRADQQKGIERLYCTYRMKTADHTVSADLFPLPEHTFTYDQWAEKWGNGHDWFDVPAYLRRRAVPEMAR